MTITQNPRPYAATLVGPMFHSSPEVPLPCLPLPLVNRSLLQGFTSISPFSLVLMADIPLFWCGPCHPERVGGRAGRRSRRLPGKEGLIFPTLPLPIPCELWNIPGRIPLSLAQGRGRVHHPWKCSEIVWRWHLRIWFSDECG